MRSVPRRYGWWRHGVFIQTFLYYGSHRMDAGPVVLTMLYSNNFGYSSCQRNSDRVRAQPEMLPGWGPGKARVVREDPITT
jgi:hypothetical protein